jgi:predicted cobalt transporter CbtA
LPHAIGAPHPGAEEIGPAPPELAAQFVMNSLFASAVMWAVLGLSAAYVFSRMMAGETSNLRAPKAT